MDYDEDIDSQIPMMDSSNIPGRKRNFETWNRNHADCSPQNGNLLRTFDNTDVHFENRSNFNQKESLNLYQQQYSSYSDSLL